jgi:hypothetical protein
MFTIILSCTGELLISSNSVTSIHAPHTHNMPGASHLIVSQAMVVYCNRSSAISTETFTFTNTKTISLSTVH